MKIRLVRNLGTRDGYPPWKIGDEVDAEDDLANKLVSRGLAEVIRAVPEQPAIRAVPPSDGGVHKATADAEAYQKRFKKETKADDTSAANKKEK